MSDPLDLGHGVTITYFVSSDEPDAPYTGLYHAHPDQRDPSRQCGPGAIWFDVPATPAYVSADERWHVDSWEPLTLSPSLLCMVCGHHGFIRQGRWVPA